MRNTIKAVITFPLMFIVAAVGGAGTKKIVKRWIHSPIPRKESPYRRGFTDDYAWRRGYEAGWSDAKASLKSKGNWR